MHIMCVHLFRALSRRVGALQISIIIIIIRESALKADSGRKILCHTRKSNQENMC